MRILTQPVWMVEQCVLTDLITQANDHAWELSGIRPEMWADKMNRQCAEALCRVRDSGHRVHARTVGWLLRHDKKAKAQFKKMIRTSPGTHGSMTVYVSELVYLAAQRRAA